MGDPSQTGVSNSPFAAAGVIQFSPSGWAREISRGPGAALPGFCPSSLCSEHFIAGPQWGGFASVLQELGREDWRASWRRLLNGRDQVREEESRPALALEVGGGGQ